MTQRGLLRTATLVAALAAAVAASVPARSDVGAAASTPAAVSVVGLRAGDQGPEVVAVQQRLLGFGYVLRAGADGVFGPDTARALRHFQASNGLNPTGVVTENTARYLGLSGGVAAAPPAVAPAPSGGGTVAAAPRQAPSPGCGAAARAPPCASCRPPSSVPGSTSPAAPTESSGRRPSTRSCWCSASTACPRPASSPRRPRVRSASLPTARLHRRHGPPTPATPAASGYVGLARGSTGPLVRDVQRALLATGMALRGGADGVFGPATDAALRAYQRVNGLKQSGVVDAATARLMGLGGGGRPSRIAGIERRGGRVRPLRRARRARRGAATGADERRDPREGWRRRHLRRSHRRRRRALPAGARPAGDGTGQRGDRRAPSG